MKFRGHETFFIRKGWLSKGMEQIVLKSDLFVDKNENPMDILGIGSNMVKSLRYWLQVVGLTVESNKGRRVQTLTDLGQIIYDHDRYIEELGTLHLLQYKMVNQKEAATAWYYFFNEFTVSEFTKEDFIQSIQNYIMLNGDGTSVASRSLSDDFGCIINTYLPRYKLSNVQVSPENNIDCPFGELGLIDIANKKNRTYRKAIPSSKTFNPWVIFAVILDNAQNRDEISLNELLTSAGNIGKIYNLDAITMLDVLHNVEKLGLIKIIRTAGLDIIHINQRMSFCDCVLKYYESIE